MKFPCDSPFTWEGTGCLYSTTPIDFPDCSYESDSKDYPDNCTSNRSPSPSPSAIGTRASMPTTRGICTANTEVRPPPPSQTPPPTKNHLVRADHAGSERHERRGLGLPPADMDIDIAMTQIEPEGSGPLGSGCLRGKVWVTIQASIAAVNGGSSHVISSGWLARSDTGVTYTAKATESD